MKLIPALACSALLLGGAAFAADSSAPAPATTTAKPMASTKSMASDDCSKQAHSKKLKGKARKSFVKSCRAGK